MKLTYNWLESVVETRQDPEYISNRLAGLGIEVEEIIDSKKKFANFLVGYVEEAVDHPNSDRLHICKVNIGKEILQIVCGAANARQGLTVAVALPGAVVPRNGETLKKGVIRGIESQGMMCSTDELLLEDDGIDGIMELPNTLAPGQDLATALGLDDVVYDLSITPNRADCFSVRGIARDLAAAGEGELLPLEPVEKDEQIENPIDVEIRTSNCEYFSTIAIKNISGETPEFIAKRLRAIGQKLISLPVDIANYICFELGQPLHIYDLDKIPNKLTVRDSRQGEILKTLDGKDVILPEGAIVVANGDDEPLSLAGMMGGIDTGFSENTKNILIESAYFNKVAIAKAGQKTHITSEARTRFERGVDPELVDYAIRYAASLISKCCDCQISNIKRYGELPSNKNTIELTFSKFNALTGLSQEIFQESKKNLEKLGMVIKESDSEKMILETPSWRHDLSIEEDIIEEIIRLIGYENIQEAELQVTEPKTKYYVTDKVSDALIFNGYYEVKTFSFVDRPTAEKFAKKDELLDLQDASTEYKTLRPSVIVSHLKAIKNSQNKSQENSKIFEIGRCFKNENGKIVEKKALVATISEKSTSRNWRKPQENVSIFDIKTDLDRILNMLGINFRLKTEAPSYYHPGRSGTYIFQKDTILAHFGEIHPTILSDMGITGPVVCFELFLDAIPELFESKVKKPLVMSQYQSTSRDFSFIVKKEVSASEIINAVKKQHIAEIQDVSIFDVYESTSIGEGNKAVAFEVLLQSQKGTLSDDQIADISTKIISSVSKNCGGVLRDQ